MNIANRAQQRRIELGWEQKEAALRVGVSQQFIGQMEKGQKNPNLQTLAKICAAYGVSADWLLNLSDEREPQKRKSLPEGGSEILGVYEEMSDRGRRELLAVANALLAEDRRHEQILTGATAVAALGGVEFAEMLARQIEILSVKLGSRQAAVERVKATFLSQQTAQDDGQQVN